MYENEEKWNKKTCGDFSGELMGSDASDQLLPLTHAPLQYDFAVPTVGEEK